jgi:hypothetical protein
VSPLGSTRRSTPPEEQTRSNRHEAQWERAQQAWVLRVEVKPDALDAERTRALCRVLRVKRFEREALMARLPGVVRRGARVDLEPLVEDLARAGIPAHLERRLPPETQERNTDR